MNRKTLPSRSLGIISICVLILFINGFQVTNCMADIFFPPPPEGGQRLVSEYLTYCLQTNSTLFRGARVGELTVADSFQSYIVSSKDIISGQLLSQAKH